MHFNALNFPINEYGICILLFIPVSCVFQYSLKGPYVAFVKFIFRHLSLCFHCECFLKLKCLIIASIVGMLPDFLSHFFNQTVLLSGLTCSDCLQFLFKFSMQAIVLTADNGYFVSSNPSTSFSLDLTALARTPVSD